MHLHGRVLAVSLPKTRSVGEESFAGETEVGCKAGRSTLVLDGESMALRREFRGVRLLNVEEGFCMNSFPRRSLVFVRRKHGDERHSLSKMCGQHVGHGVRHAILRYEAFNRCLLCLRETRHGHHQKIR